MILSRKAKERIIENYLNHYKTYKVGLKNCQKQLEYISPSLVGNYRQDGNQSAFYISNNTEKVALDRMTSKKALDLIEEIEQLKIIISCIEDALNELGERELEFIQYRYFDEMRIYEILSKMHIGDAKTLYRMRKKVLDKFLISLNNLINMMN